MRAGIHVDPALLLAGSPGFGEVEVRRDVIALVELPVETLGLHEHPRVAPLGLVEEPTQGSEEGKPDHGARIPPEWLLRRKDARLAPRYRASAATCTASRARSRIG
jgi:hypothetical protein